MNREHWKTQCEGDTVELSTANNILSNTLHRTEHIDIDRWFSSSKGSLIAFENMNK